MGGVGTDKDGVPFAEIEVRVPDEGLRLIGSRFREWGGGDCY